MTGFPCGVRYPKAPGPSSCKHPAEFEVRIPGSLVLRHACGENREHLGRVVRQLAADEGACEFSVRIIEGDG